MNAITDHFGLFVSGFLKSLGIILWATAGSLLLGTVIATFRISPVPPLRALGAAYVNVVRNCPLSVVLFFIAFGFPEIGVNASFYLFAIGGLVLYTAAFVCEALRSGVNAVPAGQIEAARALGLTFLQSLRTIVLPQAFRSAIAPLGNVIIAMFKNSAVVGAFGVAGELYSVANELTGSLGYEVTGPLLGVAVGYLLLTIPTGQLLLFSERKWGIAR